MGKMTVGSYIAPENQVKTQTVNEIEVPVYKQVEKAIEIIKPVFIVKPVEYVVDRPKVVEREIEVIKPVYMVNKNEIGIAKPVFKVEDDVSVVKKPVFNVEEDLTVLTELQQKLEESVEIAKHKISLINNIALANEIQAEESSKLIESQQKQLKLTILLNIAIVAALIFVIFAK